MKLCCKCHNAPRKNHRSGYCADCLRTYNREWARKNLGRKPRPPKPVLQPGEKFCHKCERILRLDDFYRCKSKRDGRMSICKACDYMKQMTYKAKHRAKIRMLSREASRRYRAAHPGYNARACQQAKRRRIARKIEEAVQP